MKICQQQISLVSFVAHNDRYIEYEKKLLSLLKQLKQESQTGTRREYNKCLEMMVSVACCMRSSLVHPVLPRGGRDLSVLFSPTRRDMKGVLRSCEKKICVCCTTKGRISGEQDGSGFDEPEPFYEGAGEEDGSIRNCVSDADDPKLVPIPLGVCHLVKYGIRHFACKKCRDDLLLSNTVCPKCEDLFPRLREYNRDSILLGSDPKSCKIYGNDLFHGFQASKKLQTIIDKFKAFERGTEKVLICSFFKGTLDLIEAMFAEVYSEVGYERFDGDVSKPERSVILENFRRDVTCRVLFMTVQTGGVGLNLVEANHVWFLDRFCKYCCHLIWIPYCSLLPNNPPRFISLINCSGLSKQGTRW